MAPCLTLLHMFQTALASLPLTHFRRHAVQCTVCLWLATAFSSLAAIMRYSVVTTLLATAFSSLAAIKCYSVVTTLFAAASARSV